MRAFTDYESTPEFTAVEKLPAGAYVVRLLRAEEKGDALCILFDIAEGEYKDHFMEKFRNDQRSFPDKARFKGIYRLWYPKEGDRYAESTKRRMKTALKLLKDENRLNVDFAREWDGNALKGARAVLVFQEQEYEYNGYHGFSAQPYGFISMESYKSGKYTVPEPKKLRPDPDALSDGEAAEFVSSDEDLPF